MKSIEQKDHVKFVELHNHDPNFIFLRKMSEESQILPLVEGRETRGVILDRPRQNFLVNQQNGLAYC